MLVGIYIRYTRRNLLAGIFNTRMAAYIDTGGAHSGYGQETHFPVATQLLSIMLGSRILLLLLYNSRSKKWPTEQSDPSAPI